MATLWQGGERNLAAAYAQRHTAPYVQHAQRHTTPYVQHMHKGTQGLMCSTHKGTQRLMCSMHKGTQRLMCSMHKLPFSCSDVDAGCHERTGGNTGSHAGLTLAQACLRTQAALA